MSDKMQATARGLKHTLETIMSKMGNKKRKVTTEIPIDQYLAPDLKDSLFGKLTEDLMFKILCCVSRNYVFLLPVDCILIIFANMLSIQWMIWAKCQWPQRPSVKLFTSTLWENLSPWESLACWCITLPRISSFLNMYYLLSNSCIRNQFLPHIQ